MDKTDRGDQILSATRWLSALVIPFLVVAFVILFLLPQQTEKLFAWKIQPTMSAMMLGAAYAGGIYFFTGVLRSKKWHKIKVGFLPITTFASLLGIATILHWDKFNQGHISFFAWAGLYFTTPFIVFTVWLRNRGQDPGQLEEQDIVIPQNFRRFMGVVGMITLVISWFLFLQPNFLMELWPWTLTPLTARVMGAMFALPGLVGLGIASDQRWSSAGLILQSQGFSILLILIAAIRAWHEFERDNPASLLFVVGLGLILASIAALLILMQPRHTKNRH